jgi:hypothetical protein
MDSYLIMAAVGSLVMGLADLALVIIQRWDRATLGRLVMVASATLAGFSILVAIGIQPTWVSLTAALGLLTHLAVAIIFGMFCYKRREAPIR